METLHVSKLSSGHWKDHLHQKITLHANETDSALAKRMLNNWEVESGYFWHVVPTEVLGMLPHPVTENDASMQSA